MFAQDCARLVDRFRQNIKENSHAFAAEDHAARVFVRLYRVVDARFGQGRLEAQRFLEFLRDIDQVQFAIFKVIGFAAHRQFDHTTLGLVYRNGWALANWRALEPSQSFRCCARLESIGKGLKARFYIDPTTGLPHIHDHHVAEYEVIEVLERPVEDRHGKEGARIAMGRTTEGRYLRVVYVPDPEPDSVFVITAYELTGKPLAAFRRRMKKKQQ